MNCPIHGEFNISFFNYLVQKRGCRKCSEHGFNPIKNAFIYILKIENFIGHSFIGYGITHNL